MRCAILTRTGLRLHELVPSAACRDLPADWGPTVRRAAFSPDGRWIAVGGLTGLGVWDLSSDAPPLMVAQAEYPTPFFSPNSAELYAYSIEGLRRWRLERDRESSPRLHPLPAPKVDRVHSAHFAGDLLVLGTGFGVVVSPAADPVAQETSPYIGVTTASVSPGVGWVAVERDVKMAIYRLKPWAAMFSCDIGSEILTHAFSPKGEELAVATSTGLTFVHTNGWKTQRRMPAALDRRARILFAPDGRSFWLAHDARTAALYDTRSFALLLPLAAGVLPLAISPDGNHMLVSIDARRLQLRNWAVLRRELEELNLGWSR
jgi:hypothetical protein